MRGWCGPALRRCSAGPRCPLQRMGRRLLPGSSSCASALRCVSIMNLIHQVQVHRIQLPGFSPHPCDAALPVARPCGSRHRVQNWAVYVLPWQNDRFRGAHIPRAMAEPECRLRDFIRQRVILSKGTVPFYLYMVVSLYYSHTNYRFRSLRRLLRVYSSERPTTFDWRVGLIPVPLRLRLGPPHPATTTSTFI